MLQMVGGGKMGQALVAGMVSSGWISANQVAIVEVSQARRQELAELFDGSAQIVASPLAEVDTVLAVKPHLIVDVAAALDKPTRVLSIAAGITIAAIEAALPADTPVIRVMPNTPALVGLGASAIAGGLAASEQDLAWATEMLSSVGVAEVVTEAQLDAVTGLSGSGPAYYFLIAEAMVDAAVAVGLTRQVAQTLAYQTMAGAAAMLANGDKQPAELRADVTTPNGTTAAGLKVLEQQAMRGAIGDAVAAATARARELGASALGAQ